MEQSLQGMKLLTRFIARDQRASILELEREMRHLADTVDGFYALLGPRNWIFHELLNLSRVEEIVSQSSSPGDAEQRFIELYRDAEATKFWFTRLRNVTGMRERLPQIERARKHYYAGQFDSCALQLIAVMDGFVNDFEPQSRKGLAARDPDDMTAWDSVVGHHLGLTNVLKTYTKTVKRRIDDEVTDVYRHGIVHGSVVRFDNVVVATKAWNMFFSVIDWATAVEKSRKPPKPEPSLSEVLGQLRDNERVKKRLRDWSAGTYVRGDSAFEGHDVYRRTTEFLTAWQNRNYGALADLQSHLFALRKSQSEVAGELRREFEGFDLTEFSVMKLRHEAPAICEADGEAVVNGDPGLFTCRWLLENETGEAAFGSPRATWRVVHCWPHVWRRAETDGS